jgi:hypothetical protein
LSYKAVILWYDPSRNACWDAQLVVPVTNDAGLQNFVNFNERYHVNDAGSTTTGERSLPWTARACLAVLMRLQACLSRSWCHYLNKLDLRKRWSECDTFEPGPSC